MVYMPHVELNALFCIVGLILIRDFTCMVNLRETIKERHFCQGW